MIHYVYIGEHIVRIVQGADLLIETLPCLQPVPDDPHGEPHITLTIRKGYGVPFRDYEVTVTEGSHSLFYRRADFLIAANKTCSEAVLHVHNDLALKHALMTLYSSYIVKQGWGVLIHSSCVVDQERAHLFAGPSGAGKSTIARYSYPKKLLSDEATLVKVTSEGAVVFHSPFRSELESMAEQPSYPLASIQLLHQAVYNERVRHSKTNGLLGLMDKVFYWGHDSKETGRILGLLTTLVDRTPVYELYFQKNETFWELIS